ncbi:MAG: non-canonical purine NTP pyrophosphatase [Thermoleophilia bacterium]|nr:non-canonical purine NTP pyrophosphatase [Thermoleophilia bacterium]
MDRIARLASGNPHKLAELQSALPGWRLETHDAGEPPPETGATYYENARIKARFGRSGDAWSLGEDSGIEVEGLAGGPGVLSARFAGPGENPVEKLLAQLEGMTGPAREARYVCELVAISPSGVEVRGTGVLRGRIAESARGSEGFGYDPVFLPAGEKRTVAELGNAWKREHSHRARAAQALLAALSSPRSRRGV